MNFWNLVNICKYFFKLKINGEIFYSQIIIPKNNFAYFKTNAHKLFLRKGKENEIIFFTKFYDPHLKIEPQYP